MVYRDMLAAELKNEEKLATPGTPTAVFLNTGLKIQSKQYVVADLGAIHMLI